MVLRFNKRKINHFIHEEIVNVSIDEIDYHKMIYRIMINNHSITEILTIKEIIAGEFSLSRFFKDGGVI